MAITFVRKLGTTLVFIKLVTYVRISLRGFSEETSLFDSFVREER